MPLLTNLRDKTRALLARHFENIGLAGALFVTLLATALGYWLDPDSGSLPPATFQLLAFAPVLLFLMLHVAIWSYKHFLRPWFKYLKADEPKLFEDLLPDLETVKNSADYSAEYFKACLSYYRLKFTIRCVRTVFSWFPLLVLLYLLLRLVQLSLALVPH